MEDEEFLMAFGKLITKFGETCTQFLIGRLPDTSMFFDMMIQITAYSGNSDIAQIPFYFWFSLEDMLDHENEINQKEIADHIVSHGHEIMAKVLEVLVMQIKYPSDQETANWTKGC